jgi:hypothetical protein
MLNDPHSNRDRVRRAKLARDSIANQIDRIGRRRFVTLSSVRMSLRLIAI